MRLYVKDKQMETPPNQWNTRKVLDVMEAYVLRFEYIDNTSDTRQDTSNSQPQNKLHQNHKRVFNTQVDEQSDDDCASIKSDRSAKSSGSVAVASGLEAIPLQAHVNAINAVTEVAKAFAKHVPPGGRLHPKSGNARKPCLFCDSLRHRTFECSQYPDWSSRRDRLKEKGRCIKCLDPRHRKNETCRSRKVECEHCKQQTHNRLLCSVAFPAKEKSNKVRFNKIDKGNKLHKSASTANKVLVAQQDQQTTEEEGSASEDDSGSMVEYDYSSDVDYSSQLGHLVNNVTVSDHDCYKVQTDVRTILMTTKMDVSNPEVSGQQLVCSVFFDGGSDSTLITKAFANKLNLAKRDQRIGTFHGFNDPPEGRKVPCWTVDLDLHLQDGSKLRASATAVDSFCSPMPVAVATPAVMARVIGSQTTALPTSMDTPQILIGQDIYGEFDIKGRRKKLASGFHVYDSRAGPLIGGKGKVSWNEGEKPSHKINHIQHISVDVSQAQPTIVAQDQLLEATEKMWKTEAIGIEAPEASPSQENDRVMEEFLRTLVQLPDGRYEVAFPFREEILEALKAKVRPDSILPSNYKAAQARLFSVWKSYLRENHQVRESYSKAFQEQLEKGIIEVVDDKLYPEGLVHYLAHHPVFREDKPTKLRVVFDGSARAERGARSLNDCLHPGPSLLESLIGLLLRSRISPYLVLGDIEKAFLQISIRAQDRDVTRFLWLKDPSKQPTPDNLVVYRYCRVPFGLNSSPFLLLATVGEHLNKINSPLTKEIRSNAYSDNVFLYAHTAEEAVEKYKGAKEAFSQATMNVREFISNCPTFSAAIPEADLAKETKEKTLGHQWDSKTDMWHFVLPDPNPHKLNQPHAVTSSTDQDLTLQEDKTDHQVMVCRKVKKAKHLSKRLMLSVIHSLWDPLGQFAPVTLQARLKYQSLWDKSLGWDECLPEASARTWEEATQSWANAKFEVPRFLFHGGRPCSVQLHVFVDASDESYGGVAYLRVVPETGSTYSVLIFGKNRLVTKKPKLSIPRKELMAAIIGCRVITFLRKQMVPELQRQYKLDAVKTYLWSDNQGVLFWIKDSDHCYGRFVQNRLVEIRNALDVTFLYVPTKDNPADVLSRGATVEELRNHSLWWTGSPWLTDDEKQWPSQPSCFQPFSAEILEIDAKPPRQIMSFAIRKQDRPTSLFDEIRNKLNKTVRTYPRIRRVAVNVLRAASGFMRSIGRELQLPCLKHYTAVGAAQTRSTTYLALLRYNEAELALVFNSQLAYPPTEEQCRQFCIERFPDGLLRCRGRLEHSGLPSNTIYPAWLPERTWIARYIVHTIHVCHVHASVETTLALLRRRFWLVKGRRNISTIIRKNCVGCRIAHGPAFRIPEYAKLPAERLRQSRPFTHIGLDLFGPFLVRMGLTSLQPTQQQAQPRRGRKPQRPHREAPDDLQKVWGVIFTCMATRAVHLDVVHSQSAEHLLQASDRFMCRRGHPTSVTSDNAPSIILVNRTLDQMWKQTMANRDTTVYCRQNNIEWHYITPESPWQGGFYERLIRSVKDCLRSALGRSRVHFSHFTQLIARVEHTINCRPLTAQSVGDIDVVPLRPIDFLQPLAEADLVGPGPQPSDGDEDYNERLTPEQELLKLSRRHYVQLDKFWDRWRNEYLLSLRETQQALNQSGRVDREPEVGEYVFVDDDELVPRSQWKFARIVELIPGRDGTIRTVKLRFPGGAESERHVKQLHPMELRLPDCEPTEEAADVSSREDN